MRIDDCPVDCLLVHACSIVHGCAERDIGSSDSVLSLLDCVSDFHGYVPFHPLTLGLDCM